MFGGQASMTFTAAIGQILLLDAVFSIDNPQIWY
jgi:predicted tellurium resistance membrane protein TerC